MSRGVGTASRRNGKGKDKNGARKEHETSPKAQSRPSKAVRVCVANTDGVMKMMVERKAGPDDKRFCSVCYTDEYKFILRCWRNQCEILGRGCRVTNSFCFAQHCPDFKNSKFCILGTPAVLGKLGWLITQEGRDGRDHCGSLTNMSRRG